MIRKLRRRTDAEDIAILYPFEDLPCRVFLDTNVLNVLVKWGGAIFDGETLPEKADATLLEDIEALRLIFFVGQRASWELVASPKTLDELGKTPDDSLRNSLLDYGVCFLNSENDYQFAFEFGHRLKDSHFVAALPDAADRQLIGHAVALGCDAFVTCDRRSILRKRDSMRSIPLRILAPAEWWAHIKPWARLWI